MVGNAKIQPPEEIDYYQYQHLLNISGGLEESTQSQRERHVVVSSDSVGHPKHAEKSSPYFRWKRANQAGK